MGEGFIEVKDLLAMVYQEKQPHNKGKAITAQSNMQENIGLSGS